MVVSTKLAWIAWGCSLMMAGPPLADRPPTSVEPARVTLLGPEAMAQIVAIGPARFRSLDPRVARVDSDGLVSPVGDGSTAIEVSTADGPARVAVVVSDFAGSRPVDFVGEILPILSRHGCNAGSCHGKASGRGGFRLSLFESDPGADHDALAKEGRGRRVFPPLPPASLLLRKPTAQVPHGGGRRFEVGSPEYRTLARWIGQGMPAGRASPTLARLAVGPRGVTLGPGDRQQLRVDALDEDGIARDVTRLARYTSNTPDLVDVDERGLVQVTGRVGEASVLVRFGGLVGSARLLVPAVGSQPTRADPPSSNFIDSHVFGRLRGLGLAPAGPCTDGEFARRSSLDLGGRLPDPTALAAFERDDRPDKRARWVDALIDRPEHADLFARRWAALLGNRRTLGDLSKPSTFAFHGWIRESLAENKPYDRFVGEILAARGDPAVNPPAAWYRLGATAEDRGDDAARVFLGVRLSCARCHHHPSDRWGRDDARGFAAFFARVGTRAGPDPASPSIYNRPTGFLVAPRPPGGPSIPGLGPRQDPRDELVGWFKRPDNPYFARALVNRYWGHFFGRGLVEPVDDLREGNPASDPDLLDALAGDFVRSGYDLKRLVRTLATSRAYDRSSEPGESGRDDRRDFARFAPRRLPADVLLDAVGVLTGSPEVFVGVPRSTLAVQLPDDGFPSAFLEAFDPRGGEGGDCDRAVAPDLPQALHLLHAPEIQGKLAADSGRAARLAADPRPAASKVEQLYRLAFSRDPTDDEVDECLAFVHPREAEGRARQAYEDLIWALISTKEFQFNH